ncbi:MAG: hypothetical protein ACP5RG_06410 [Thermoplasmata archaeon]
MTAGSRKNIASFFEDFRRMRMIESLEKEILRERRIHGTPGR